MATLYWLGNAVAVAQVSTITIDSVASAGIGFYVTINGKTVTAVSGDNTTTGTAAALAAALEASTIAEFVEISWAANGSSVVATSNTAGVPFSFAVGAEAGGSISASLTTAATGPNDWSNGANWLTGLEPASADTVYIQNSTVSILYGLPQTSITLAALNIAASFTGNIGLAQYTGKYQQYRPTFLAIGATLLNVGYGSGSGSPLIRIDTGSVQTAISVSQTGASSETGLPAFCWRGNESINSAEILRGSVGIGAIPGDNAGLQVLSIGYITSQLGDAQVYCGPGSTVLELKVSGGATSIYGSLTTSTLILNGGSVTVYGTTSVGPITVNAGTLYWNSTGTLGAADGDNAHSIGATGTLDLSQDMNAKTFYAGTTITCVKGATINDPNNVMAAASGKITVQPSGCSVDDLNLNFGIGRAILV